MNGPALLALQLVDSRLDAIEGRRKRLPERAVRDTARAAHAELATERARLQGLVDAAYVAIEQAETAGAELDTKQRRLEAQLKTVIAPREAEALMHEIDLLKAKRRNKEVIFYLIGILPEYQNKGVTAIIFGEYYKTFAKNGVETCIRTPELEENHAIQ